MMLVTEYRMVSEIDSCKRQAALQVAFSKSSMDWRAALTRASFPFSDEVASRSTGGGGGQRRVPLTMSQTLLTIKTVFIRQDQAK